MCRDSCKAWNEKKKKALEAITINPAKTLGIDERVGSIEVGKDADIVIWIMIHLNYKVMCISYNYRWKSCIRKINFLLKILDYFITI